VESILQATLRDILIASLSLDDGLSKVQGISFRNPEDADVLFDIARALEEIILHRPGLANAKLTELVVRMSFNENRVLPEMLILLDTRYTNSHRRAECEILPDLEALPRLIDILGELSQAITSTIRLNLRPVLPFLSDEVLMTLNAIYDRRHDATISLALHEVHYLAWILVEAGFFEGSELLLNRLIEISGEISDDELTYEVTFDYACVLTELKMFDKSRDILNDLKKYARRSKDSLKLAEVTLQLGVNETRDDSVDFDVARMLGDKAAEFYDIALKAGSVSRDEVGLAHLVIGSSILANGWREGVSNAVERLELGLRIYDSIENKSPKQMLHVFRTLTGLGFAHGLMGDHENMGKAIEHLSNAKEIIKQYKDSFSGYEIELSRVENAIGWLCLSTESDEFWEMGIQSFKRAEEIRTKLLTSGQITDIEILGTRMGLAFSTMRSAGRTDADDPQDPIREIIAQYIPLFPTDPRAYEEIAIATFDLVWLLTRHGGHLPPRLRRLLDDVDRMLEDAETDSIFIQGVSLIFPYLENSWNTLLERSKQMSNNPGHLSDVSKIIAALAVSKMNLDALNLELGARVKPAVDDEVLRVDALLAQYWLGQTFLVQTIRAFYDNKDYSELASGLYAAALAFNEVLEIESDFGESVEFIKATCASMAQMLRKFSLTLENQYAAYIDRSKFSGTVSNIDDAQYSFILAEDWLGLVKIANSYLQMVEQSEIVEAQPYLNAVFSNINRALKMMDAVSLIDRRVLALLGAEMNRRYYLRM
jgi:tetratricopeptide (TPR) repeat protein